MLESIAMKEIPLTRGKVTLVDDEDFEELSKYKWFVSKHCNTFYAMRMAPRTNSKRHTIKMHRIILKTSLGMETDHINGNGLDNRRENLRVVTHRKNGQNLHIPKSSQFPGVSWHKETQKWLAAIQVSRKKYNLGYYDDETAAARRYQIACDWQVMEMEVCT